MGVLEPGSRLLMDPVVPATWPEGPLELRDAAEPRRILGSELLVRGRVWDVRRDTIELGDGQTVVRDLVVHTGAVGVLALDEQGRLLLVRQYRHPVAMALWEPVAGLLDLPTEPPLEAARRELVEEAGLVAGRWDVLLDYESSPGGSSEALRLYLARGLAPAPGGRPPGEGRSGTCRTPGCPSKWHATTSWPVDSPHPSPWSACLRRAHRGTSAGARCGRRRRRGRRGPWHLQRTGCTAAERGRLYVPSKIEAAG